MSPSTVEQRILAKGPKRILSLDGGGLLGLISLGILETIEQTLTDRGHARLCDYYDLIGGASTGSIIAAGIATGRRVEQLTELYLTMGSDIFVRPFWSTGIFGSKYQARPLTRAMTRELGHITLGSDAFECGFAAVAKRLDASAPWIIHNNPRGRFFDVEPDDPKSTANRDIPVVSIIRASTAAPTFFAPEFIKIAENETAAFVDGGVSPYNNPALLMTMMASQEGYGFNWSLGAKNLLVTSIGTGSYRARMNHSTLRKLPSIMMAVLGLRSIIADNGWHTQHVMQWLSDCKTPWQINSEARDAQGNIPKADRFCVYQRYDTRLEEAFLEQELGITLPRKTLDSLRNSFDDPSSKEAMLELGRRAGTAFVKAGHFPNGFDRVQTERST